ncbi:hypothetical protein FPSE_06114 [Fusarium pseudograminearum CS3096]|uniref:Uncharacterized protein n=1 Tax=Fusarium pseudograminearum (strain CS3096) TaxID=1028729 RepID=K3VK36_FUSPC|nr:hypothetical protein FPSE_06114 [Fusarium pseudograminearum CS3096]EKJ73708.1 hypothetical protein FPSE_06114 [Fusarium pseudograminearum CS3096]
MKGREIQSNGMNLATRSGADPSAPWSTHRDDIRTQPALNKVASGYEYQAITSNKSETNTTARQAHRELSPQVGYDTWVVYQVSVMLLETISHIDANHTLMAKVARLH